MLTASEQAICAERPNTIDHGRTGSLQFLGNYTRTLPVSIARMMENAYDWEHLPHVHESSFRSIELIDSGSWGWRAKVGLQPGGDYQIIDLLVDMERKYWATTVFAGKGSGLQIHTQATERSEHEIDIDVRFYLTDPSAAGKRGNYVEALKGLYSQLYDEDVALMSGRQRALDDRARWQAGQSSAGALLIGDAVQVDRQGSITVELDSGRFCVRRHRGAWLAHSAVCTHLLGPLDGVISTEGIVTCPWHGYRFDAASGRNIDGKCRALAQAPAVEERDGKLYLVTAGPQ